MNDNGAELISSDRFAEQPPEEHDREVMPVDTEEPPRLAFPVVGIGASAGGLEAYTEFFKAMPADSGMAFVLILHLPPDRNSLVAEILAKHTAMPVAQVEDGVQVEPNHIYVIRPGHTVMIDHGKLHLGERLQKPGNNRPVDDFFKSLAVEQRERAIAMVMSGMGSNGAAGAQAIKAVGGLCIAQDPESAQFPSMPRHLIDAGYADYILRPQDIPDILLAYTRHSYALGRGEAHDTLRREQQHLREVLAVLRSRTRQDFSGYKKPTVLRRVQRRMGLNRTEALADYSKILRQSPTEVNALADDLLIHVTGFFRDADAWEALRHRVIAPMIGAREAGSSVRCWVAACSSGEEAYTLAMLLVEESERANKNLDIKVFATDMAERTLQNARAGLYPGGIESEIEPDRLERFFQREDAVYRVRHELREKVVFAPQNVLQDPPFSRLDIATCRNLLIYLEPEVQHRVLELLHFGLRDGGTLFLGTSETVAGVEELFEPIDKKARIYRRMGPTRHGSVQFPLPHALGTNTEAPRGERHVPPRPSIGHLTARTLLEHHAPAAVTVDRDHRIIYFHGNTSPYLDQPRGEITRDLMMMVRQGLRIPVRAALQQAAARNGPAATAEGWVEPEPDRRLRVAVTASLLDPKIAPEYLVVSFQNLGEQSTAPAGPAAGGDVKDELRRVRDELQSTIEELQTSNEELKAAHEEVMSMNEELQSSNEELETSREELQSLNEELTTVNAQLQAKMEVHQAARNDLSSLLTSTDIAVLFLDTAFHIRRFTPAVKDLLDLIPADVGRPLNDLARKFHDPDLLSDAQAVLDRLAPAEREIPADGGRWYFRRITPYRTADDRITGVVVTFVDITERRRHEQALAERARLLDLSTDAIVVRDIENRIVFWNRGAINLYGWTAEEAIGRDLHALLRTEGAIPLDRLLAHLKEHAALTGELVHTTRDGRRINALCRWAVDRDAAGQPRSILTISTDITGKKREEEEREALLATVQAQHHRTAEILESISDAFYAVDADLRFTYVNGKAKELWRRARGELIGRHYWTEFPETLGSESHRMHAVAMAERRALHFETMSPLLGKWIEVHLYPDASGGLSCYFRDISERKQSEEALRESEERLRLMVEGARDFAMLMLDPDRRITVWNVGAERMLQYTEAEAVGQEGKIIFTPEDVASGAYEQELATAEAMGRANDERWHVRKDKSRFWGSGVLTALRSAEGTLRGFVKVLRDETARKRAEDVLEQAREAAEQANRAKDEFLATVSHELRTPLSAILLWVNLLHRKAVDREQVAEGIAAIKASAEAQKELIDDLLDTSRIASGKLRLQPREIDLAGVIHKAVDAMLPAASAKGVILIAELQPEVGVVWADAARLTQIALNLLSNAIKFTPSGGEVRVRLTRHQDQVELRVTDTGQGIGRKILPYVFDPFRQADASNTRRHGGLGLGLAISKQLVELHGGVITAASEGPGRGATFTVFLPLPDVRHLKQGAGAGAGAIH